MSFIQQHMFTPVAMPYLFGFGDITGSSQDLLMSLWFRITPGNIQETVWGIEN